MDAYHVFRIGCGDEKKEMLMAAMADIGFEGFVENERGFEAYIPEQLFHRSQTAEIFRQFDLDEGSVSEETLAPQNWNEQWESSFEPVWVADKIRIRAPFHEPSSRADIYELIIQPKTSFGTGHHETTQLVLELMLECDFKNKSVLDYGCGTGVLAVMAAKLGAEKVDAIDIDEWSAENTADNAALNGVSNISHRQGTLDLMRGRQFDVILANINRNILLQSFEALSGMLPAGPLLISGFYTEDLDQLTHVAAAHGFRCIKKADRNNWCAALLQKG